MLLSVSAMAGPLPRFMMIDGVMMELTPVKSDVTLKNGCKVCTNGAIITPDGKVFSDNVEMVTFTGSDGEMGVLPQHMPLMTLLVAGEVIARKDSKNLFLAVGDGFVQVTGERVAILTDMAIKADDIDEAAAADAMRKAEARLAQKLSNEEAATVQASLTHAATQLKVKQRHKKI